jgi:hypothetical protein
MSYEFKSAMRWGVAIFAVIVVSAITLIIWNARAYKSTAPSKLIQAENTVPTAKPGPLPAVTNASQVPKVVPGETCEEAEKALGKPMEKDEFSRTWQTQDFVISATTDTTCHLTDIGITVIKGHKALTADGIILGATTLADAEKILRKQLAEPSESVEAAEGHWLATLHLAPGPGMPFKAAYGAYIASDEADAMPHDPTISDFRDLPITQYNLEMVDLHNQAK